MKVEDFNKQLKSGDYARSNLYTMHFGHIASQKLFYREIARNLNIDDLSFMSKNVTLPAKSLGTLDVKRFGAAFKLANDVIVDTMTMTIICNSDMRERVFFENWMAFIGGRTLASKSTNSSGGGAEKIYRMAYYDDYVTSLFITMQNRRKVNTYEVECFEAFPTNVGPVELAWGDSSETVSFTVTFAIRDWEATPTTDDLDIYDGILESGMTESSNGDDFLDREKEYDWSTEAFYNKLSGDQLDAVDSANAEQTQVADDRVSRFQNQTEFFDDEDKRSQSDDFRKRITKDNITAKDLFWDEINEDQQLEEERDGRFKNSIADMKGDQDIGYEDPDGNVGIYRADEETTRNARDAYTYQNGGKEEEDFKNHRAFMSDEQAKYRADEALEQQEIDDMMSKRVSDQTEWREAVNAGKKQDESIQQEYEDEAKKELQDLQDLKYKDEEKKKTQDLKYENEAKNELQDLKDELHQIKNYLNTDEDHVWDEGFEPYEYNGELISRDPEVGDGKSTYDYHLDHMYNRKDELEKLIEDSHVKKDVILSIQAELPNQGVKSDWHHVEAQPEPEDDE